MSASLSGGTTATPNILAHNFATALSGKMEDAKVNSNVQTILAATQSYPATGSIAGLIFYDKIQVQLKDGSHTFNGNAGGIGTPGGGALIGDVYTSDLNKLVTETTSFAFTGTPVYFAVYFFDKNHNNLGSFQAGAVSTVLGTGGGSGSWG